VRLFSPLILSDPPRHWPALCVCVYVCFSAFPTPLLHPRTLGIWRRHVSAAPATPVCLIQHTSCVLLFSAHGVLRKSWLCGPGVHPPACLVASFRASASGWDDLRRRTTSAARSSDLKFVLSRPGGIPSSRITLAFSTSPSSCSELSSFVVCLVA